MKSVGWKPFLFGFVAYFLATRPLLDYAIPALDYLLRGMHLPHSWLASHLQRWYASKDSWPQL